ncbi:metalloregulator ArsR/SmtB family transcription factor [Rothia sp. LK2588]|uniref:ArsR/SmtB family transcription factor n=1 Tax=Rothia sp. LK2588 TaxID=3114369 RepID=UPI0034CDA6EE
MTLLAHPSRPDETATCSGTRRPPVPPEQTQRLAGQFKALADPNRLTLLTLLPQAPETICVCELTAALNLSQPTVSHHLKILTEAGMVLREKRGTWVHYSQRPGSLEGLSKQLLSIAIP